MVRIKRKDLVAKQCKKEIKICTKYSAKRKYKFALKIVRKGNNEFSLKLCEKELTDYISKNVNIPGVIFNRRTLDQDTFDSFKTDQMFCCFVQYIFQPSDDPDDEELSFLCDCQEGVQGRMLFLKTFFLFTILCYQNFTSFSHRFSANSYFIFALFCYQTIIANSNFLFALFCYQTNCANSNFLFALFCTFYIKKCEQCNQE